MSTSAGIGMTMPDGTIKAVYLHGSGYIVAGAGETLAEHYTEREKVEKLIKLGFLSRLEEKVAPDPAFPHSWAHPQENVTVAYYRDRHDRPLMVKNFKDRGEFGDEGAGRLSASYLYLFENGRWLVSRPYKNRGIWMEIKDAIEEGD